MVQGIINQVYNKTLIEKEKHDNKRYNHTAKEWFCVKWKMLISSVVVITILFIITGIIMYMNLMPHQRDCRRRIINVHIVPYLESVIDTFNSPKDYFEDELSDIIDGVINELKNEPSRRFTISETYPLWKWWQNKSVEDQEVVRTLINDNRLEIAGGGWCIPDEASVHYTDFIDQFTLGLRRLKEIAGRQVAPDAAMLVDNNGHSKNVANILRAMEFKALVLGGINPQEQCNRMYEKMEFLWNNGGILSMDYENPNIYTTLLDERAAKFSKYFSYDNSILDFDAFEKDVICHSHRYTTNNVIIPVQSYLRISSIRKNFMITELLANTTSANPRNVLNIFYSTPSQYFKDIQIEKTWSRAYGEFLPYSRNDFEYWTGYYASRPAFRYLQRLTSEFLQVFKQIASISYRNSVFDSLNKLMESFGLCQHHKVTGVACQSTANYFTWLLDKTISQSYATVSQILNKVIAKHGPSLNYESCLRLNISECLVSETSKAFIVTVYNPSGIFVDQYVRIPVVEKNYVVRTGDGKRLKTQIVRVSDKILKLKERSSEATKELIFRAERIPPLGFKSYYITVSTEPAKESISTKPLAIHIDNLSRQIIAIERHGRRFPVYQELAYYASQLSCNSVFSPEDVPEKVSPEIHIQELSDGEFVTEYEQTFGSWASQIVRVYKDEDFVEFKWIVGPLPVSFLEGKEVVNIFKTDIKNGDIFYVDNNGKGFERTRRSTKLENENIGNYIARNYRPVNSHIGISDSHYQLHVFNDRAQGGGSVFEGQVELMVHRKLIGFQFFDVSEDLNERAFQEGLIATGQHWLFVGDSGDETLKWSIEKFQIRNHQQPWYFFARADHISFEDWKNNHVTEFSRLRKELPDKLKILSLEPWNDGRILLRLENTDERLAQNIQIDLRELFAGLRVVRAMQVTIAGNGFKECNRRHVFEANAAVKDEDGNHVTNFMVSIAPTQIAAYVLEIEDNLS